MDVHHDGVVLSINGSELDADFPESEENNESNDSTQHTSEPGLISSSEDEAETVDTRRVASKVVRASKQPTKVDKFNKFSHLRNDPDFREFLDKIIDSKMDGKHEREDSQHRSRDNSGQHRKRERSSEVKGDSHGKRKQENNRKGIDNPIVGIYKSPSDTTLYSPELQKAKQNEMSLIDKISNFVENI